MSTQGERKCALLLASLAGKDRRWLMSRLPRESSQRMRGLVRELDSLQIDLEPIAQQLLGDELRGLTEQTSVEVDKLIGLSHRLPPAWFARILESWTGIDSRFCISLLDASTGRAVQAELSAMPRLPVKLVAAIRAETEATIVRPALVDEGTR